VYPYIGRTRLDKVTPAAIESMYGVWAADGYAASTRRRRHGIVHAVFADAYRLGSIDLDPMGRVRPTGGKAPERDIPSTDDVRAIIDAGATHMQRVFLRLAASTGARRGSLVALTWRHVDLDSATLWFKVTKESKPYTVHVDAGLVDELRELKRQARETAFELGIAARLADLPLFTNDGEHPWYDRSASRVFELAMVAAERDGFTLHALRHYHATECLRAGMPSKAVADRLGCTEANVIATYSHRVEHSLDDLRAAELAGAALA
jgi:integrase